MRKLTVGFGKEKVMPQTVMPLGGVGLVGREYTGIHDELYITCIAFTDEAGKTVLVYTQDFLKSEPCYVDPAKEEVSQATGIPVENIMIASTHTHAAPAIYYNKAPGVEEYRKTYREAAVKAAQTALADRSAADIYVGTTQAEGMAFSRHYIMPDGSIQKTPGKSKNPVAHPDEPDQQVQLVRFARGEERQDIILIGFTIHPTFFGKHSQTVISADVACVRDYVEEKTGALAAYFTGAAGNQTGVSQIAAEDHGMDFDAYCQKLGRYVVDTLPKLLPVSTGEIRLKNIVYSAKSHKEKIELYDEACEIARVYMQGGQEAIKPLLEASRITTLWEANAIKARYEAADTVDMPLSALSVGGLSFVFAPYEMFAPNSVYIKNNTPFDMTFVVSCANGSDSYLPTKKACAYPVYESYVTRFAPGTAELIADTFLDMLNHLKNS